MFAKKLSAATMKRIQLCILFSFVIITSYYHYKLCIRKSSKIITTSLEMTSLGPKSSYSCKISINAIGRFGNIMGEYATLYSLSKLNNRTACILPEMSTALGPYFQGLSLPTLSDLKLLQQKHIYILNDMMQEAYKHLPKSSFLFLSGHSNSWTFYHHIRDEILREFRFNDEIISYVKKKLYSVLGDQENVTLVGVHVRRSDYVSLMNGHYHGVLAHSGFFDQAMDCFNKKYHETIFLVVSDDLTWCQNNINNSLNNVHFVGNNDIQSPVYDMALMAYCNHSIIDIGTFGFWGAYLAGGETIYLANYTLPDSPMPAVIDYVNTHLPEWIPMAADLSAALPKYLARKGNA